MAQTGSNLRTKAFSFIGGGSFGAIFGAVIVTLLSGLNFIDLIIAQFKVGWTSDATHLLLLFAGIGALLGFLVFSFLAMENSVPYSQKKKISTTQVSKAKKSHSAFLSILGKILTGILVIISCTASGGIILAGIVLFLFAHYRPSYFTLESFKAALIANAELAVVTATIGAVIGFVVGIVFAVMGKKVNDVFA